MIYLSVSGSSMLWMAVLGAILVWSATPGAPSRRGQGRSFVFHKESQSSVAKCVALSLAVLEVEGSNPAPACSCVSVFSSTLSCGMPIPKRCNLLRLSF
jgi:hypothetical protein